MALSDIELRVLGSLVEQERVTLELYPLSTQAHVTDCNQRTRRDPVNDYNMQEALDEPQKPHDKGLAGTRHEVTDTGPKLSHSQVVALKVNSK